MFCDPAAAAWQAAGQPPVDAAPPQPAGRCGRCGAEEPTVLSSQIISQEFTGLDGWPFGSRRLCVPCAWAYSHKLSTAPSLLITTATVDEYSKGTDLLAVLLAGPLPTSAAVVFPTSRRRHILPAAKWGHLAVDGLVLRWDARAAERLRDVAWLRGEIGATWPQLGQPAPPARLLTSRPSDQWAPIMRAWEQLADWRSVPPLWDAARILTNRQRGESGVAAVI